MLEDWLARIAAIEAPALGHQRAGRNARRRRRDFSVSRHGGSTARRVCCAHDPAGPSSSSHQGPYAIEHTEYHLGPLSDEELAELFRVRRVNVNPAEAERIAAAALGHPLYAQAVADALLANPAFDLRDLPKRAEDFFRRAVGGLQGVRSPVLDGVLGLISPHASRCRLPNWARCWRRPRT